MMPRARTTRQANHQRQCSDAVRQLRPTALQVLWPCQCVVRSLGAALNAFAGALNIFPKAVGSTASDSDNSQERGDSEQNNDTLNYCIHITLITVRPLLIDLADGGPLFLAGPQDIAL